MPFIESSFIPLSAEDQSRLIEKVITADEPQSLAWTYSEGLVVAVSIEEDIPTVSLVFIRDSGVYYDSRLADFILVLLHG